MTVKEELKNLLENAQYPYQEVYLSGSGDFVDTNGNIISPFDILKALYKKQDAINRGLHFVAALPNQ